MTITKFSHAAAVALALIGFGLAPSSAFAGSSSCRSNTEVHHHHHHQDSGYHADRRYSRDYRTHVGYKYNDNYNHSRSRSSVSFGSDNVRFSVSYGSNRSYTYDRPGTHRLDRCNTRVVRHVSTPCQASGYWKRVYRQPVYEWRYDYCGRPYRVCVRAGYYERVWVSTPCSCSRCR